MKRILFFTSFIALILSLLQGCGQSNARSNQLPVTQEPAVESQSSNNNQNPSVAQFQIPNEDRELVVESQGSSNDENSSVVQSQNNGDMNISRSKSKSTQYSTSSSGYTSQRSSSSYNSQESTLSLKRVDLNEPHMLSIQTSGKRLIGKIVVNDELVKQLRGDRVEFDLSPYLSVGENTVEINARYTPSSSTVDIEMKGPQTNVSQQNSGNGTISSNINIMVR